MIRINLLPIRADKKRESLRFHMTVAVLMLVLVLVACSGFLLKLRGDIGVINGDIKSAEKTLADLKVITGPLTNIEHQKELAQSKLDTVEDLEDGRTGPVRLFNMIRDALPEKVWVKTLKDNKNSVALTGVAGDEDFVSEFITRLEYHEDVTAVKLKVLQSAVLNNHDVVTFSLDVKR